MKKLMIVLFAVSLTVAIAGCRSNGNDQCSRGLFQRRQACYPPPCVSDCPVVDDCFSAPCSTPACSSCTSGVPVAAEPAAL